LDKIAENNDPRGVTPSSGVTIFIIYSLYTYSDIAYNLSARRFKNEPSLKVYLHETRLCVLCKYDQNT
jgi:hypothetical protein